MPARFRWHCRPRRPEKVTGEQRQRPVGGIGGLARRAREADAAAERQAQGAATLARFLKPRERPAPGEACEMCTEPIRDNHPHVVNTETRSLVCTCRGCYLLFTAEGAGGSRYRAVPVRRQVDPDFALSGAQWEALQIPVGIAFFFVNSVQDRTVAFYPSPAGATESELPLEMWDELVAANPMLAGMLPDVEALLVRRETDGQSCYLVPIDVAYELTGIIRQTWRGFDGGTEAREAIDAFFAGLDETSRPVQRSVS